MLTKAEQSVLRADLFRHLDGIAIAAGAYALHDNGVLKHLLENGSSEIRELSAKFKANEGYLNVALRGICSQGWLRQEVDNVNNRVVYTCNSISSYAFGIIPLYKDVVELLKLSGQFHRRKFEVVPFKKMKLIFDRFCSDYGMEMSDDPEKRKVQEQILKHIEGHLIGPSVVLLGMNGMFHKYFMEASFRADEFHQQGESFEALLDVFLYLGWFAKKNKTFQFTDKGLFYARRASAYGVTVSYLPTFRMVDELIFGDPDVLRVSDSEPEIHVDREMNVWGSGGAHASYFKKVDDIIIELFNRPIEEQPKGVLDMGCGNGAFLIHIFEVIEQRTLRGRHLEEFPLLLVGADFNEAALKVTRANLIKADIWAKVVWGDIGRPDVLANHLSDEYGIELGQLLNVRTFLDHNRIWAEPEGLINRISTSTGAFVSRGVRLNNAAVEENLLQHFNKWVPYISNFGLLIIELHTVDPALVAANLGKTAATAYDATHGFSDQYIVEPGVFLKIAEEAGLYQDENLHARFPDSDLATVTVNLLKGK